MINCVIFIYRERSRKPLFLLDYSQVIASSRHYTILKCIWDSKTVWENYPYKYAHFVLQIFFRLFPSLSIFPYSYVHSFVSDYGIQIFSDLEIHTRWIYSVIKVMFLLMFDFFQPCCQNIKFIRSYFLGSKIVVYSNYPLRLLATRSADTSCRT